MLLSKSQLKHPPVDSPPFIKRGKKALYGSASMMLVFMVSAAPYAQAQNEDSQGTIQFTEGKYEVPEMSGKAVLCVERRGGDLGDVMVMYGTTSGSANAGSDYMPTMGHIMWANGDDSTKPVVIHIKKDPAVEKNKESFYVTLLDVPQMNAQDGAPPQDGAPKDGVPPQDGMMPGDMAQYCMPKDGTMPPPPVAPDGDMMDDMGNPATVYFGGRFQAEVKIVDNKEPPPPPVEALPPGQPGQPGQPGPGQPGQDGQPGQGGPDTSPSGDDGPSTMTPGEPPVGSDGEQVELAPNSQAFTNIFSSLTQTVVVTVNVDVNGVRQVTQTVVTKQTIGVSKKLSVFNARIKFKSRTRSDDDGFTEEEVNAFFDLVESQFPTIEIDREQVIEEGVDVGSLGEILLPTTSGSWVSINPLTIAPAIATSLAETIVANTGAELVINEDGTVTYLENGSSITVTPNVEVTPSHVDFNATIDGDTIVVEGGTLSQVFHLQ